jgi:hypothetical protein
MEIGMRINRKVLLFAAAALVLGLPPPAFAESGEALLAKYPAVVKFKGKPAAVDLASHKDARAFRTRLSEAAPKGTNFAGHMTVITWGCGTLCQIVALIDARDGRVSFGPTASVGVKHRLDSRLLVLNPPENAKEAFGGDPPPDCCHAEYYVWDKGRLTRIYP